jgi:hypothetical protein
MGKQCDGWVALNSTGGVCSANCTSCQLLSHGTLLNNPGGIISAQKESGGGKKHGLFPTFYAKLIILPRQARDKDKQNLFLKTVLSRTWLLVPGRRADQRHLGAVLLRRKLHLRCD